MSDKSKPVEWWKDDFTLKKRRPPTAERTSEPVVTKAAAKPSQGDLYDPQPDIVTTSTSTRAQTVKKPTVAKIPAAPTLTSEVIPPPKKARATKKTTEATEDNSTPTEADAEVKLPRRRREKLFPEDAEELVPLSAELRATARLLGMQEVRAMVGRYYSMQKIRIAAGNAKYAAETDAQPSILMQFINQQMEGVEGQIGNALNEWSMSNPNCQWMREVVGIGPIISAGMMAYLNIERARSAGSFWRYAGLDPSIVWLPGQIRPFNAKLKLLCWKAGQSFVKVSNNDRAVYGKMYRARREMEDARNQRGDYSLEAMKVLATRNFRAATSFRGNMTDEEKATAEKEIATTRSWYERGMFPPGRIQLRATRYAVTIFLSHLFEVMFFNNYGYAAPRPYVFTQLNHVHFIVPPHLEENFPKIYEALRKRQPLTTPEYYIAHMGRDFLPPATENIPSWFNGKDHAPRYILDRQVALLKSRRIGIEENPEKIREELGDDTHGIGDDNGEDEGE